MSAHIGDLEFDRYLGSLDYSGYLDGRKLANVLAGQNHIYLVGEGMYAVAIFEKDSSGKIGDYVMTKLNWRTPNYIANMFPDGQPAPMYCMFSNQNYRYAPGTTTNANTDYIYIPNRATSAQYYQYYVNSTTFDLFYSTVTASIGLAINYATYGGRLFLDQDTYLQYANSATVENNQLYSNANQSARAPLMHHVMLHSTLRGKHIRAGTLNANYVGAHGYYDSIETLLSPGISGSNGLRYNAKVYLSTSPEYPFRLYAYDSYNLDYAQYYYPIMDKYLETDDLRSMIDDEEVILSENGSLELLAFGCPNIAFYISTDTNTLHFFHYSYRKPKTDFRLGKSFVMVQEDYKENLPDYVRDNLIPNAALGTGAYVLSDKWLYIISNWQSNIQVYRIDRQNMGRYILTYNLGASRNWYTDMTSNLNADGSGAGVSIGNSYTTGWTIVTYLDKDLFVQWVQIANAGDTWIRIADIDNFNLVNWRSYPVSYPSTAATTYGVYTYWDGYENVYFFNTVYQKIYRWNIVSRGDLVEICSTANTPGANGFAVNEATKEVYLNNASNVAGTMWCYSYDNENNTMILAEATKDSNMLTMNQHDYLRMYYSNTTAFTYTASLNFKNNLFNWHGFRNYRIQVMDHSGIRSSMFEGFYWNGSNLIRIYDNVQLTKNTPIFIKSNNKKPTKMISQANLFLTGEIGLPMVRELVATAGNGSIMTPKSKQVIAVLISLVTEDYGLNDSRMPATSSQTVFRYLSYDMPGVLDVWSLLAGKEIDYEFYGFKIEILDDEKYIMLGNLFPPVNYVYSDFTLYNPRTLDVHSTKLVWDKLPEKLRPIFKFYSVYQDDYWTPIYQTENFDQTEYEVTNNNPNDVHSYKVVAKIFYNEAEYFFTFNAATMNTNWVWIEGTNLLTRDDTGFYFATVNRRNTALTLYPEDQQGPNITISGNNVTFTPNPGDWFSRSYFDSYISMEFENNIDQVLTGVNNVADPVMISSITYTTQISDEGQGQYKVYAFDLPDTRFITDIM